MAKTKVNDETIYVYGGSFDPPHEGHLSVIQSLLDQHRQVVVAPTVQNPFKVDKASPLAIRMEMLEAALENFSIPYTKDLNKLSSKCVYLSSFPYHFACDFVDWWRSFDSREIYWVVASDIAEEATSWKNWDAMKISKYVFQISNDISSSDIRKGLTAPMSGVAEVIKKHRLYEK